MTLENDAKFEEKLTGGLENDIKNLKKFDPFLRSKKYMSLKIRGDLCAMRMKNSAKFEEEWT